MLILKKDIGEELNLNGYSFVNGSDYSLTGNFKEFYDLTHSWEHMEEDQYYNQVGRAKRFRRYSDFQYNPEENEILPIEHRAYFQSENMNKFVGGKQRHFEDISKDLISNPVLRSLVKTDFDVYRKILPKSIWSVNWQCQIHQIRIEVEAGKETEITPEGIHSDGYPFSGVHFWGKENISGAKSYIYTKDEEELIGVTYENILDTIYFRDRDMKHYVTPASTADNNRPGYRQIIAISFSVPNSEYDIIR